MVFREIWMPLYNLNKAIKFYDGFNNIHNIKTSWNLIDHRSNNWKKSDIPSEKDEYALSKFKTKDLHYLA